MLEWITPPSLEAVLGEFCRRIAALAGSGNLPIALTGGKSAARFYDAWAAHGPAGRLRFFWSDERLVPLDDPDSNYGLAVQHLFHPVGSGEEHAYPPPIKLPPAKCALEYGEQIRQLVPATAGGIPRFPLIILGLGEDGHTASLFPGRDPYQDDTLLVRAVEPTPQHPHQRLTFTPTLINSAERVWFLVTGAAKSWAVEQLAQRTASPREIPALAVDPALTNITVFCDPACAPHP